MTEINEIKTSSINTLTTGRDGSREVLLVGLKPAYQDKPQYLKSLKREFATCHETDHPNIIKYIEEKQDASLGPCIVMEWEPARTLADYLQENHSVEEKKNIVRQIADATAFLHAGKHVHGALNPQSIFITTQGDRVKILNFRLRYADHLFEPQASVKFRAPEAKDGTVTLDARADIFSLGTILKEMNLGEEYRQVIAGSCSFGRNDRYADINTFLEAFEHRRVARRTKTTVDSSAPAGNKRAAILVAAIVTLIVVAALVFFNRQTDNSDATQPVSEMTDTTQPTAAPAETAAPAPATTAEPAAPSAATAVPEQSSTYTGELAFLNELVPQMHIDIDKIYAKGGDAATTHKKVAAYYKGLRKALGNLNDNQFAAYDKAFAEYIQQKNANK